MGAPESDKPIVAKAFRSGIVLPKSAEVDTPRLSFSGTVRGLVMGLRLLDLIAGATRPPGLRKPIDSVGRNGIGPNRVAPGGNLPIATKNQGSGGSMPMIDIAVK